MKFFVRCWKKILCFLVTGSTSIFIAACYGVAMDFRHLGDWFIVVHDQENKPIKGLEVTILQFADGVQQPDTVDVQQTDSLGSASFVLTASNENVSYHHIATIKDIDSTDNGGLFRDTTVRWNGGENSIIKLTKLQ